jgi:hypothetical protein
VATEKIYFVLGTDGTNVATIYPGKFNGPSGITPVSDLTLYGLQAPYWGEGFDTNFYRLLENFAIEESATNVPQTKDDVGLGNGINNPIEGQLWYNKTQSSLMVYNGTAWVTVGGSGGVTGDYLPLSGGTLSGDLNMGSNTISNLADPVNNQDAVTKKWVFDYFVQLVGDELTGKLRTPGTVGGDVDATLTTKGYVDAAIESVESGGDGTAYVPLDGSDAMTGNLHMGNHIIDNVTSPTLSSPTHQVATVGWVQDEISNVEAGAPDLSQAKLGDLGDVNVGGVTNGQSLIYSSGNWIPGTAGTAGATKTYELDDVRSDARPANKYFMIGNGSQYTARPALITDIKGMEGAGGGTQGDSLSFTGGSWTNVSFLTGWALVRATSSPAVLQQNSNTGQPWISGISDTQGITWTITFNAALPSADHYIAVGSPDGSNRFFIILGRWDNKFTFRIYDETGSTTDAQRVGLFVGFNI